MPLDLNLNLVNRNLVIDIYNYFEFAVWQVEKDQWWNGSFSKFLKISTSHPLLNISNEVFLNKKFLKMFKQFFSWPANKQNMLQKLLFVLILLIKRPL
jgi:hypothetical protein